MKKRIISLLLAIVMCLSVVACGGGNIGGNTGGKNDANKAASKEGVFDVVDIDAIKDAIGSKDFGMSTFKAIENTLYMVADVYTDYGYTVRYITADMDGNVKTNVTIYEENWGEPAVGAKTLEAAVAVPDMEVLPDTEVNENPDVQVWHNIYGYKVLSDGKLAYIDSTEEYNNSTGMSTVIVHAVVCDTEGNELSKVWLNEKLPAEEHFYVNNLVESEANTIYVLGYDYIFEVDFQGTLVGQYETTDVTRDLYNVAFYKNGYPVFATWNTDGEKQTYKAIDIRTAAVIEEIDVMDSLSNYSIYDGTGSGYELVLTNNTGVYGYNVGDEEPKQLMNYINSNLNTYRLNNICFIDSEHFVALYSDFVHHEMHIASFTKVPPENVPDRQTLIMATYGSDREVIQAVIDFNKSSDTYKILVKDYSQYATNENWMAGYDRLNNEIIAGQMPDILQCNENLQVANYASKGLLVDFYELMEKDETINREDYAENVFRAYETEGKLYQLPTSFYIWTVLGKTEIWGEEYGITWDEVKAVQAKYPEASLMSSEIIKTSALNNSLMFAYGQLVDEVTGECHFDSDVFKNLLEYANSYPAEINYDELYSSDDYWMHYQTQYMEDRTLLLQSSIYNLYEAWRSSISSFNEPVTPVGFPTDEGKGSMINAISSYAISSKSAYIDGAWSFVKQFIGEEKQLPDDEEFRYAWGIPVMKKAIEEMALSITQKPFYLDENGEKVEYDDYLWINDEQIPLEPGTEADMQKWLDFVYSVDTKLAGGYDKAMEIISEEVESYFAGQKRVEDVMSIIQSRMSIFISESR